MSTGLLVRQLESEAIIILARAEELDEEASTLAARIESRVLNVPENIRNQYREELLQRVLEIRGLAQIKRSVATDKIKLASQWQLLLLSEGLGITHG